MKKERSKELEEISTVTLDPGSKEGEHLAVLRIVTLNAGLFTEEEIVELQSLERFFNDQPAPQETVQELIQAAPKRQPEWWKEMILSDHPVRRAVAEWAVRCYGRLPRAA